MSSLTQRPRFNFTTAETYQRRRQRQRTRKFNLNLFMYGALYRKINRWENCWDLQHNPLEDISTTDATYLSFANPNYHFEDQLNSNISTDNQYQNENDTEDVDIKNISLSDNNASKQRKKYANLDFTSMGLVVSPTSPLSPDRNFILQKLNSPSSEENSDDETYGRRHVDCEEKDLIPNSGDVKELDEVTYYANTPAKPKGFLGYYTLLEAKARERQCSKMIDSPDSPDDGLEVVEGEATPVEEKPANGDKYNESTEINSPDSNDSGIQSDARSDDGVPHVHGPVTDDIYAVVDKTQKQEENTKVAEPETTDSNKPEVLPVGWEKCEDDDGAYYWHIKSGTIQRDPPSPAPPEPLRSVSVTSETSTVATSSVASTPTSITSNTEEHLQEFEGHALQYAAKSLQSLCSQPELREPPAEDPSGEKPIRFAVRSLGWVRIAEEDLTPERSSKAVNKCIVDLSLGRNDINDVVGRWGDGKDLYMDLDCSSLRLIDTQDGSMLNSQPIHSIRVWGVGRDNGRERDFAYVARDRITRRHMCHVFRCDTPARQIANTLRDICKKIMVERTAMQRLSRPTDLPNLDKLNQPNGQKLSFQSLYNNASFPTPMEEPKKIIRCHYLGTQMVSRATGTDTLNEAIELAYRKVPPERWVFVSVAIAPSTITITEHMNPDNKLDECRVRFLSFMGIAMDNVKLCAFIMHSASDKFVAHVFHCEPSAGPLCKTIEAACKLRYQKCLDAHPQTPRTPSQGQDKGFGATLKAGVKASVQSVQNVIGILKSKKAGQC